MCLFELADNILSLKTDVRDQGLEIGNQPIIEYSVFKNIKVTPGHSYKNTRNYFVVWYKFYQS